MCVLAKGGWGVGGGESKGQGYRGRELEAAATPRHGGRVSPYLFFKFITILHEINLAWSLHESVISTDVTQEGNLRIDKRYSLLI